MSKRTDQVSELIKRELSNIIVKEFDCPNGVLITITEVDVSIDFENAKVLISIYPENLSQKVMKDLDNQINEFQSMLFKRLKMRIVPRLFFRLDDRLKIADEVEKIIEKIHN